MHAYVCTSYAHSDFTRALVGVYVIEVTMNLVLIWCDSWYVAQIGVYSNLGVYTPIVYSNEVLFVLFKLAVPIQDV